MKLSQEEIVLFTDYFLDTIDYKHPPNSVLNALSNVSVLPYIRPVFLTKCSIHNLVQNAHPHSFESILKILSNISSGTAPEKKLLFETTFPFLLSAFECTPRLSHKIFYILNNFLDLLKPSEIDQVLSVIEYSVFQNHDVLFSAASFFENLLIRKNKMLYVTSDLKPRFFSCKDIQRDDMDIIFIEFISLSYQFFDFEDTVIQSVIKIIVDRLSSSRTLNLKYYKSLNRLLEAPKNQSSFLELNGLEAIILSSSRLKKLPPTNKTYQDLASNILSILSKFTGHKLNAESVPLISLMDFYENLFIESDLIVELTRFILKFDFGSDLIANKLSSVPFNSESQINIITGLAEIEMTTEICTHMIESKLCCTLFSILENLEQFDASLHHVMAQAIINLYSRKALRERYSIHDLADKMKLIVVNKADDPDLYVEWLSLLSKIDDTEPCIDFFSLEPYQRIDQIIFGSYAINELPHATKKILIKEITDLLDTPRAAIALEILARNKHYSNLLSNPFILSILRDKLEQQDCFSTTKVAIIDTLFWLTVNNHRNTHMIINTITLPLLLNQLTSSDSSDDVIRATMGLMVNTEFTDENNQTLLSYLELFIYFLKSKTLKVVINTLQLLESLACVHYAFITLDEDNRMKLYKQLMLLKRKHPDIDDMQSPIETLCAINGLFDEELIHKMNLFEHHIHRVKNNHYLLFKADEIEAETMFKELKLPNSI